jgi:hypothetical protein
LFSYEPARDAFFRQDADVRKKIAEAKETENGISFLGAFAEAHHATQRFSVQAENLKEKAAAFKGILLIGTGLVVLEMSSSLVFACQLRRLKATTAGLVVGAFLGCGTGTLLQMPPNNIGLFAVSFEAGNYLWVVVTAVVCGSVGMLAGLLCSSWSGRQEIGWIDSSVLAAAPSAAEVRTNVKPGQQ